MANTKPDVLLTPFSLGEDEMVKLYAGFDFSPVDLTDTDQQQVDKIIRVIVRTRTPFVFFMSKYLRYEDTLYQIPEARKIFLLACKRGILGLVLAQPELKIEPAQPIEKDVNNLVSIALGKPEKLISSDEWTKLIDESKLAFRKLCSDLLISKSRKRNLRRRTKLREQKKECSNNSEPTGN